MFFYYCFEAKSIQGFILDGGKLRDMVAASELVEQLTTHWLEEELVQFGLQDQIMPRKGGGAFTLPCPSREKALAWRDYWSFFVQQKIPGLQFVHGILEASSLEDLPLAQHRMLQAERNRPLLRLPLASPYAEREPRTGRVATAWDALPEEGSVPVDEATHAKRLRFRKISQSLRGELRDQAQQDLVTRKLQNPADTVWPLHLKPDSNHPDQPAMLSDSESYVAIIHADGNNLGALLHQVRLNAGKQQNAEDPGGNTLYNQGLQTFSAAVEQATCQAASAAVRQTIARNMRQSIQGDWVLPARPLILGGDDLTFIVRADAALDFTEVFLKQFEKRTKAAFKKKELKKLLGGCTQMTACAGIVFVKAAMPFGLVYRIAESLCHFAKKKAKANAYRLVGSEKKWLKNGSNDGKAQQNTVPATLAFHRVTTSTMDSLDNIQDRELTHGSWTTTMQPYSLQRLDQAPQPLAQFSDLLELAQTLGKTSRGAQRELLRLTHLPPHRAKSALERWRENLLKSYRSTNPETEFETLKRQFLRLTRTISPQEASGAEHKDHPGKIQAADYFAALQQVFPLANARGQTPLGDIVSLAAVGAFKGEDHEPTSKG